MKKLLNPQPGDKILGFGEGNGYFCNSIANSIKSAGYYLITDPSKDQLNNLERKINVNQIKIQKASVENISLPSNFFDKVWSFGAFHHCNNKIQAMQQLYRSLNPGGKLVICDVFQGSDLAKHFDSFVARYCLTGHEVSFLSDEFALTLCELAGFQKNKIEIIDLDQKWKFNNEHELGDFIYKLHALTKIPGSEKEKISKTFESCKNVLGVSRSSKSHNNLLELNWPMKALVAIK